MAQDILNVSAEGIEKVDGEYAFEELNLQWQAYVVLQESLDKADDSVKEETAVLHERNNKVRFLREYVQALNSAADEKTGEVDFEKNPELKALREKAKGMKDKALELEEEADQLEIRMKELEGQIDSDPDARKVYNSLKQKVQSRRLEAKELMDIYRVVEADSDKKSYSKDEKKLIVDSTRDTISDFNTLNNMQAQKVKTISDERSQAVTMARTVMKTLDEMIKSIFRAIRGG